MFIDGDSKEIAEIPKFEFCNDELDKTYDLLNTNKSSFDIITQEDELRKRVGLASSIIEGKTKTSKKKQGAEEPSEDVQKLCKQVFGHFSDELGRNISKYVEQFTGYDPNIRKFLGEFNETMIMNNYPRTVSRSYSKQKSL